MPGVVISKIRSISWMHISTQPTTVLMWRLVMWVLFSVMIFAIAWNTETKHPSSNVQSWNKGMQLGASQLPAMTFVPTGAWRTSCWTCILERVLIRQESCQSCTIQSFSPHCFEASFIFGLSTWTLAYCVGGNIWFWFQFYSIQVDPIHFGKFVLWKPRSRRGCRSTFCLSRV